MNILFKTEAELKQYVSRKTEVLVVDLKPSAELATEYYILQPILGQLLYDDLYTAYDADSMSAAQQDLLHHIRLALGPLTMHEYIPHANVTFSSGGLVVMTDEAKTIAPASTYRVESLRRQYMRQGMMALDGLITYLEANVGSHPLWAAGSQYFDVVAGLLNSAAQFQDSINIFSNRWLFLSLKPVIRRHERDEVTGVLGTDQYNELVTVSQTRSADSYQTQILTKARHAVAHLSWADGMIELGLSVDQRGITTHRDEHKDPAEVKRLQTTADHHQRLGEKYLEELKQLADELAAAGNLPTYAASDKYVETRSATVTNTKGSGVYKAM